MRLPSLRYSLRWLMVVVVLAGLGLWVARRVEALRVEQALARKQLAVIDKAWAMLKFLHQHARIEANGGTIGMWGRRRLEALRRAGAGKVEIVTALEEYAKDLERFEEVTHTRIEHFHPTYAEYEIQFLRIEAEIWLNEEKAR